MFDLKTLSRRKALLTGIGGGAALLTSPLAAWAKTGEDPEAIITAISKDAFKLFGSLNGKSNSWSSRRRWAQKTVSSRFAHKAMGEKAGSVFLKDFSSSQRRVYDSLIEDVVVETLLDMFSAYDSSTSFKVNRVRTMRSGEVKMESVVSADGTNFAVDWFIINDGGKCKVSNLKVVGLPLVTGYQNNVEKAFRSGGAGEVISWLKRDVARSQRKRPN